MLEKVTGGEGNGAIRTFIHKVRILYLCESAFQFSRAKDRCTLGRKFKRPTEKWKRIKIGKISRALAI